jgi:hypothetical protein
MVAGMVVMTFPWALVVVILIADVAVESVAEGTIAFTVAETISVDVLVKH